MDGTEDRDSEVLKAARSLFYKRTRTLYRWVYSNMTKYELNRRVTNAWKSASQYERNIYISEVLGRFGTKNRTVILNPRLEEIMGLPASLLEERRVLSSSDYGTGEAQRAVEALMTSNENAVNMTSDFTLKGENITLRSRKAGNTKVRSRKGGNTTLRSRKGGSTTQRSKKRKRPSNAETGETDQLGIFNAEKSVEEAAIRKCISELKSEFEFGDGPELNSELEKSTLSGDDSYFKNYNYDGFFGTNLYPDDLFSFDV